MKTAMETPYLSPLLESGERRIRQHAARANSDERRSWRRRVARSSSDQRRIKQDVARANSYVATATAAGIRLSLSQRERIEVRDWLT
jgi:hypothetical protein